MCFFLLKRKFFTLPLPPPSTFLRTVCAYYTFAFSFTNCFISISSRYLPAIGRFLIVVTFLEDALRIFTQWTDQLTYLREFRHSKHIYSMDFSFFGTYCLCALRYGLSFSFCPILMCLLRFLRYLVPWGLTHLFLIVNVIAMLTCSIFVIARKHSEYAVAGLLGVVVSQALGYGLIFDLTFFLRNLSVVGGLLMVLSDSWVRKRFVPAGLPQLDEKDRKMYVQFAGRVLLIFLFIGFVFAGSWGFWRILVSLVGLVACVMVVVGFKAKWSAVILVVVLSIFNILVNNFWTVCFFPPSDIKASSFFFAMLTCLCPAAP